MITRTGKHTCEKCGIAYDWVAHMLENNEAVTGRVDAWSSKNAELVIVNGCRLIATSKCPKCGWKQIKNLVEEPWPQ